VGTSKASSFLVSSRRVLSDQDSAKKIISTVAKWFFLWNSVFIVLVYVCSGSHVLIVCRNSLFSAYICF
jgi:hypothetical protein